MNGSLEDAVLARRIQPTFSRRLLNLSSLTRNGCFTVAPLFPLISLRISVEMAAMECVVPTALVGVGSAEIVKPTEDVGNMIAIVAV